MDILSKLIKLVPLVMLVMVVTFATWVLEPYLITRGLAYKDTAYVVIVLVITFMAGVAAGWFLFRIPPKKKDEA